MQLARVPPCGSQDPEQRDRRVCSGWREGRSQERRRPRGAASRASCARLALPCALGRILRKLGRLAAPLKNNENDAKDAAGSVCRGRERRRGGLEEDAKST